MRLNNPTATGIHGFTPSVAHFYRSRLLVAPAGCHRRGRRIISLPVAVYETGLTHQLTALPVAAVLGSVLEDLAIVFAIVLGAHLLLDLFFLRRRRRSRELAIEKASLEPFSTCSTGWSASISPGWCS